MSCSCGMRPIIDAQGKSVHKYYEILAPYSGGATAAGKTLLAGPIKIEDAFESCNGSGVVRSLSIKEFGTSQLCDIDIIFAGTGGHAIAINTTIDFTLVNAEDITLQDTISIATGDYVNKTVYYEAIADIPPNFSVRNTSDDTSLSKDLWFYIVSRATKTFTGSSYLVLKMDIVND